MARLEVIGGVLNPLDVPVPFLFRAELVVVGAGRAVDRLADDIGVPGRVRRSFGRRARRGTDTAPTMYWLHSSGVAHMSAPSAIVQLVCCAAPGIVDNRLSMATSPVSISPKNVWRLVLGCVTAVASITAVVLSWRAGRAAIDQARIRHSARSGP